MRKKLLAIFAICLVCLSYAGTNLALLKDYTVIYPVRTTVQERYAAKLLAEYLSKMTGVTVAAKREDRANEPVISVGNTDFAKEAGFNKKIRLQGYAVNVKGKNVFIRGGHPGPLNGVISFMIEDLGFRYYAEPLKGIPGGNDPGEVRIPDWSKKFLQVKERTYVPPFETRELLYNFTHFSNPNALIFHRLAPISYLSYLPKESGGVENSNLFVHTYYQMIPVKKYYKTNPEYFALQNGKRVKQTATMGSICYTNPDIPKLMAEYIRNLIKKDPNARYFSVSCNDGASTQCECQNCKPMIKKNGLPGMQLIIANEVAKLLEKDYPDIRITTLVYGSSSLQMGTITAHPNVVLFLAPIGARYNRIKMLIPLDENKDIVREINNCFKVSDNIYFWDYLESNHMPFPGIDQYARSIRFLADKGVTGYFADVTNGGASLAPLKKWLYSQLLWNPKQDIEPMIPEFVNAYYGIAAPEILEYIALIRNSWKNFDSQRKKVGDGISLAYTADELKKMTEIFEKALKKVQNDPVHYGRAAREYVPLLVHQLAANPVVAGVDTYQRLAAKGKEMAKYLPERSSLKKEKLIQKWDKKIAWNTRTPDPDEYSQNTVTVRTPLVVGGLSAMLDDPAAVKGKAARHIGKKPWGIQWNYNNFIDFLIPEKEYVLRISFRAEQKTLREKGKVFDMWLFHHGNTMKAYKQPVFSANFDKQKDSTGKYRTEVLGKVILKNPYSTGMFWMNSLVNSDEAVWYEKIEFIPLEEYKEKEPVPNKTAYL